jgi:hypothetical protein
MKALEMDDLSLYTGSLSGIWREVSYTEDCLIGIHKGNLKALSKGGVDHCVYWAGT